jgi:hypothetical protein
MVPQGNMNSAYVSMLTLHPPLIPIHRLLIILLGNFNT